ncbi:hypothetical protein ACWEQU_01500 [Streptomyces nodosus]
MVSRAASSAGGTIAPSRVAVGPKRRVQTEAVIKATNTTAPITGWGDICDPSHTLAPAVTENRTALAICSRTGSPPGRRRSVKAKITPGTTSAAGGTSAGRASAAAEVEESRIENINSNSSYALRSIYLPVG